ncbi:MAG: hypothetical protein V3U82_05870 [Robiginitomaculum sp.]
MSKFTALRARALRLTLTALSAAVIAAPAMAADIQSYRQGQAYTAIPMLSSQACAQICTGDAQCHGWNFLPRHAPNTSTGGMCELNSVNASPISHPYAISGDNGQANFGGQVVPGGAHTIRIGTPPKARPTRPGKPKTIVRKRLFAPIAPTPRPAARQIPTHAKMPIAPIARPTHIRRQAPIQPRAQIQPQTRQQMRPQARQQAPSAIRPAADPRFAPRAAPRAMRQHSRRQMPAQTRPAPMQTQRPQMPETAPRSAAKPQHAQRATMAPPQTPKPSLYGSLYDTAARPNTRPSPPLAKPVIKAVMKAPLYGDRPAQDSDAAITTSRAVPTVPVTRSPLGLAGPAPSQ